MRDLKHNWLCCGAGWALLDPGVGCWRTESCWAAAGHQPAPLPASTPPHSYDYAANMHSSDWERIEEQEPLHGTAVVAEEVVTADAVVEVVEVVETPGNDGVDISSTVSPADNGSGRAPHAP